MHGYPARLTEGGFQLLHLPAGHTGREKEAKELPDSAPDSQALDLKLQPCRPPEVLHCALLPTLQAESSHL